LAAAQALLNGFPFSNGFRVSSVTQLGSIYREKTKAKCTGSNPPNFLPKMLVA